MKKKLFSIFLIFTLCFVSVEQCYADAGSIIIGGGSIAGVAAGAIAGPAVVAVFCAMMAFGMNVELTEASQEAGMTKTEFLKSKIQQYCNEAQLSYNTFNEYVLDQANVFQNGAISISDKASKLIQQFCNWLFENNDVVNTNISIWDFNPTLISSGELLEDGARVNSVDGQPFYAFCFRVVENDNRYLLCTFRVTDVMWQVEAHSANPNYNYTFNTTQTGDYFQKRISKVDLGIDIHTPFNSCVNIGDYTISEVLEIFENSRPVINDTVTGNQSDYDVSKGLLDQVNDKTTVINPNITINVPQDADITIDVNEYLEKIQDIIDGIADNTIGVIDNNTGIPITVDFDPVSDWDPTIEKEDDTDLPPEDERTPVVEDDRIPIDYDIDPLMFDLKGVFPFCLPWDIKDMLNKLNADPVAPSYTVNWDLPYIEENFTFTIDFSPYDNVASLLRKLEVLSFCVGLALITRQMILRG